MPGELGCGKMDETDKQEIEKLHIDWMHLKKKWGIVKAQASWMDQAQSDDNAYRFQTLGAQVTYWEQLAFQEERQMRITWWERRKRLVMDSVASPSFLAHPPAWGTEKANQLTGAREDAERILNAQMVSLHLVFRIL